MTQRPSRGNDEQFKVYVDAVELEKFRRACDDMGLKYSEAARRLMDTFISSGDAVRRWMLRQRIDGGVLLREFGEQLADDTAGQPIQMPAQLKPVFAPPVAAQNQTIRSSGRVKKDVNPNEEQRRREKEKRGKK